MRWCWLSKAQSHLASMKSASLETCSPSGIKVLPAFGQLYRGRKFNTGKVGISESCRPSTVRRVKDSLCPNCSDIFFWRLAKKLLVFKSISSYSIRSYPILSYPIESLWDVRNQSHHVIPHPQSQAQDNPKEMKALSRASQGLPKWLCQAAVLVWKMEMRSLRSCHVSWSFWCFFCLSILWTVFVFSRFSQLPIEYETRDGMEKTSCNRMQLRSLETFAVFQRSKCRFKVAYTSAWGCLGVSATWSFGKLQVSTSFSKCLSLWVVQDEDMRPHGHKRQCDLVSSSDLPFANIAPIAIRHTYLSLSKYCNFIRPFLSSLEPLKFQHHVLSLDFYCKSHEWSTTDRYQNSWKQSTS